MCVSLISRFGTRQEKLWEKSTYTQHGWHLLIHVVDTLYRPTPKIGPSTKHTMWKKKSFMFEKTTASERLVYIGIGINLLWHLRRPDSDFDGFFPLFLCVCCFSFSFASLGICLQRNHLFAFAKLVSSLYGFFTSTV